MKVVFDKTRVMEHNSLVFASEPEARAKAARLRSLGITASVRPSPEGFTLEMGKGDRVLLERLDALEEATPAVTAVARFVPTARARKGRSFKKPAGAFAVVAALGLFALSSGGGLEPGAATNDGRVALSDDDGDGAYDRAVVFDRGQPSAIWRDTDHDGVYDHFLTFDRRTGLGTELVDRDGDGFPERSQER